jgi:hypothetical protein
MGRENANANGAAALRAWDGDGREVRDPQLIAAIGAAPPS